MASEFFCHKKEGWGKKVSAKIAAVIDHEEAIEAGLVYSSELVARTCKCN